MSRLAVAARSALALPLVAASLLGVAALASSCAGGGGDEGEGGGASTSGRRVTLATAVAPPSSLSVVNEEGWTVDVTRALVSIGALHYFSGEPIESAQEATLLPASPPAPALRDVVVDLLGVRVAHAHPGHYAEGDARGEMLTAASVDLLARTAPLAAGDGITGLVRSARFTWGTPATGAVASALGDAVVHVEGRARREGEESWFALRARADQLPGGDLAVDGCVFDRVELEGDGTVTVTVDPTVWIAGADFTDAPEGAEGAPAAVPDDVQAASSFRRGLAEGAGYRFSFTPG